jgi:signal transduction histidine kinase
MHIVLDAPEAGHLPGLVACQQAFLGHELPNHLVALQGLARLLGEDNLPPEEAQPLAKRLAVLTRKVDVVSRRLADISRALTEPAWGLPASVLAVAEEAAPEARAKLPDSGLTVRIEGEDARTPCSGRLLRLVFRELFLNSGQARHGATVTVFATTEGPYCRVCVRDDGPGLSDDARALLLEPFAAGRRPDAAGAGLGFFLVRQAAARWRARLEVVTAPARGMRVELFLPLTPPED